MTLGSKSRTKPGWPSNPPCKHRWWPSGTDWWLWVAPHWWTGWLGHTKGSGRSGNQSEQPGNQYGWPRNQSGQLGNQSERLRNQSGRPGNQSGRPGNQSGQQGNQSGQPENQSGQSGNQSGRLGNQSGWSRIQSGRSENQSEHPGNQLGKLRNQSGQLRNQSAWVGGWPSQYKRPICERLQHWRKNLASLVFFVVILINLFGVTLGTTFQGEIRSGQTGSSGTMADINNTSCDKHLTLKDKFLSMVSNLTRNSLLTPGVSAQVSIFTVYFEIQYKSIDITLYHC